MGIGEPSHRVAGLAGQLGDAENRLRIRRRRVSRKARDEAAERLLGACEPLVGGGFGGLHRGDQLGGRRLGLRRLCPFVERGSLRCLVGFGQGADGLGGQLARVGGVAPFGMSPATFSASASSRLMVLPLTLRPVISSTMRAFTSSVLMPVSVGSLARICSTWIPRALVAAARSVTVKERVKKFAV